MEALVETSAAATPVDQYLDVKGVTTRYWTGGSAGSPVVLIPCLGGYVELWRSSFDALATEHRVYALEVIGQGRTAKPSGASYDLASLAQFVRDFMTLASIERAHMVGHSLGGAIATHLAIEYPETVNRLVLIGSPGLVKGTPVIFRLMGIPIIGDLLTRPSRSSSARTWRMMVHDESLIDDRLRELDYEMYSLPGAQRAFLKIVRECGKDLAQQAESLDGPGGLATTATPVLVVWGLQDKLLPATRAEVAASKIPNATIKLFDHCGHAPMLEHPQEFNALLLDFLSD